MTATPANPPVTAPQPPVVLLAALAVAVLLIEASLYVIAVRAPPDITLGIVQKIFYFHVGSAFAMLLCMSCGAVFSLVDLVAPSDRVDAMARATIETGLVFAAIVLTTGPLWARKSWGAWWTWEPRLTLTLLAAFIAVAVIAVRGFAAGPRGGRKIGNALIVLAAPTAYLIHIAVQKWGGTHPQVIQGGGIANWQMRLAFWGCVAAILAVAFAMVALRGRVLRLQTTVADLQLERQAVQLRRARQQAQALSQTALAASLNTAPPA